MKWQREVLREVGLRESRHACHANDSDPCLVIPRRPVGHVFDARELQNDSGMTWLATIRR